MVSIREGFFAKSNVNSDKTIRHRAPRGSGLWGFVFYTPLVYLTKQTLLVPRKMAEIGL